jgi:uncharacterized protein (DUF1015 family)
MSGGTASYKEVAATVARWSSEGILEEEAAPSFYVYRQDFEHEGRAANVIGVIGALELEELGADSGVLPHERTMPGPIEDRLALLRGLQMNVSPIYGIYRGAGGLSPFYGSLQERPPAARFQDQDGVLHRLWIISAPAETDMLSDALREGPLVIADGHHRYETALTYHREHHAPPAPSSAIMCFCVDADVEDLVVLPYNRVLKATGADPVTSLERLGKPVDDPDRALLSSSSDHPFVFVTRNADVLVEVDDQEVIEAVGERATAWRDLDVVALHEALLPKLFPGGVAELAFTKDPAEVRRLVMEEGWDAGVLLKPLGAAQIVDVARSGERMPQKASYFWPKAVTGLVFRSLQG